MKTTQLLALVAVLQAAGSCANRARPAAEGPTAAQSPLDPEDYYSERTTADRYQLYDAKRNPRAPVLAIVDATIMTAAGEVLSPGTIVTRGGAIEYVGSRREVPEDARVIDGNGLYVTPGLIDAHSHMGVYPAPSDTAHEDGNEMTAPVTPQVRAEYGYWPQDPVIPRALAGGVTTALILPGSANLIGGRGATVVVKPGRTTAEVLFPGAPVTVKMACGENPKRVYGEKGGPQTRMAEYAQFRTAFDAAREYRAKWDIYREKRRRWLAERSELETGSRDKIEEAPEMPPRDLGLETLAAVLRGQALVQIHCYRSNELREMVAIADEYRFSIRAFHHALEAFKVRDLLAARQIAVATWADMWGFKLEAFDGIPENAALVSEAGGRAVIHSDSAVDMQRLNQEAAKAMASGRAAGIDISENEALRWITANPAWMLGIDEVTGTLVADKRADVVLWTGHPLSVYSRPKMVIQGGEIAYQLDEGRPATDFELGALPAAPAPATVGGVR